MSEYLTQGEVLKKYKKGRMTLYRWRKEKKLRWKKIGVTVMYHIKSLEKLIAE